MNIKDIKELILIVDKTSIQRVDIEVKEGKISISKSMNNADKAYEMKTEEKTKMVEIIEENIQETDDDLYIVKSPIVGVFYEAAGPDAEPFVKVGDQVQKGKALCIIEAMKIMNEIESEESGEVVEIMVNNEANIEYGQPLMKIRR